MLKSKTTPLIYSLFITDNYRQLNASVTNYVIDFCRQRRLIMAPLKDRQIKCNIHLDENLSL